MSEILRFATAGSVDDGKSTLIGRLLYDSKSIFEDQLESVEKASEKRGMEMDLSLVTDGLRAEREQGITIDVAYRYFATPKRKFIIADTPGHIQYTRNMVTGASCVSKFPTSRSFRCRLSTATTSSTSPRTCRGTRAVRCSRTSRTCTPPPTATWSTSVSPCSTSFVQ